MIKGAWSRSKRWRATPTRAPSRARALTGSKGYCASAASVLNYEFILTPSNDPVAISRYRVRMFESLRKSDDNPASSSAAHRLAGRDVRFCSVSVCHAYLPPADARSPRRRRSGPCLSFGGLCAQFGMVRLLIRHLSQASEQRQ